MVRIRCLSEPAPYRTGDSRRSHESRHALRTHANPLCRELGVDTRPPIRSTTFTVNLDDRYTEIHVLTSSNAWRSAAPFVVASVRYIEQRAHPPYAVLRSLLLDECVLHRGSFAKNAAAFFKISRSSRRPAISRRRRRFSSSSGMTTAPSRLPSPGVDSYLRRQVCSSDGLKPSSAATTETRSLPDESRRTASFLRQV